MTNQIAKITKLKQAEINASAKLKANDEQSLLAYALANLEIQLYQNQIKQQ